MKTALRSGSFSPVLEEISEEYAGKIDIYKVNVDEEDELSVEFGIRSVPTLLFIPLKGTPQKTAGAPGKQQLRGKDAGTHS